MRLWHQDLLPKLPRQQLLGQWRECIALLGNGWGKKHRIVDYVFTYDKQTLADYTALVGMEMQKRGYNPKFKHYLGNYKIRYLSRDRISGTIYKEHNNQYLQECVDNLAQKGIIITM